jgi:hypothetical protein
MNVCLVHRVGLLMLRDVPIGEEDPPRILETLLKRTGKCKPQLLGKLTVSLAAQGTHAQFGFWALPVSISEHHLAHWQVIFVGQEASILPPELRGDRKTRRRS